MKHNDNNDEKMPEWLIEELNNAPRPTDEELNKLEYLRDDFIQAFREAARKAPRPVSPKVSALFSLQGKLLCIIDGLCPASPQPTFALARSVSTRSSAHREIIGGVYKKIDRCSIHIDTLRVDGDVCIEVNVLDDVNAVEVRPFTVGVYEETGQEIAPSIEIGRHEAAPQFPNPTEGTYVFRVTWEKYTEEIQLTFQGK